MKCFAVPLMVSNEVFSALLNAVLLNYEYQYNGAFHQCGIPMKIRGCSQVETL
jgi:hypothetical protein